MLPSSRAYPLIYVIGVLPPIGNIGDESIYVTSLRLIKRSLPNSILALALPPKWYYNGDESQWSFEKTFLELYDIIVEHPLDIVRAQSNLIFSITKLLHYHSHPYISTKIYPEILTIFLGKILNVNHIKKADINVVLSFPFESSNIHFCYSFIIPKLLNKRPLISFPISLTTDINLGNRSGVLVREALMNADIIFTRGRYTTQWILKELKVPSYKVITSADPAFLFTCEQHYNHEVEIKSNSVIIVPHPILFQKGMINTIMDVMSKFFTHIHIVPTSITDLKFIKYIKQQVNTCKLSILNNANMVSPCMVKSIFREAELVVTSRVHAGILALTSEVPVIMINEKSDLKFMDVLGHYSMERYFIDAREHTLSPIRFSNMLITMLRNIIDSYSTIKKTISRKNYVIKELAELPGKYIKDFLNKCMYT